MHRNLRIAHVAWSLDTGGVEELLYITARYNPRDRYDLAFVSCQAQPGEIGGRIAALGYPVRCLGVGSRTTDVRALFRMTRTLSDLAPDIVHLYTKVNLLGRVAARMAGVRIVICNEVDLDGQGPDRGMRLVAAAKRGTECLADRIVSCSQTVRKHWDRSHSHRHTVIPLPVDFGKVATDKALHAPSGFKNGRYPVIGMISRVHPGKGHEYLLQALPEIREAFPAVRLRIVGKGPLLEPLRTLAHRLDIAANVDFAGFVPDIAAELNSFDLFVLPSLSEGLPISILEAMAAGLPIAASMVGGVPEVVEDGVTGLLFPPRAPQALARAVVRLLQDPGRARAMGAAGRQRIVNEFSPERYLAGLDALYRDLRREKRAPAAEMG
ncbi:MAG: glycosyltransferase [Lentisphaeria bacterium]|jgi:glycosyltransferase involved in cell wall biosynthesis|nr:glycosyltransferase [Lentisphaeria bacterium]